MILVREETTGDLDAIREVNRRAFGQDEEAKLVDRLRAGGLVIASLVAVIDDEIAGHILFCRLVIESEGGAIPAVALAPMAVTPERQRQGIGSELVRRGLALCRERGERIIFVVGHPGYYPRFGFSPELARRLRAPFSGDAFMALELQPGALEGMRGTVRYPEALVPLGL